MPRDPIRNLRCPDQVWQPALITAQQQGESLASVIREALERYVAEHNRDRLVSLFTIDGLLGVDPLSVDGEQATAYRWSEAKQTFGKRPITIYLSADQVAQLATITSKEG